MLIPMCLSFGFPVQDHFYSTLVMALPLSPLSYQPLSPGFPPIPQPLSSIISRFPPPLIHLIHSSLIPAFHNLPPSSNTLLFLLIPFLLPVIFFLLRGTFHLQIFPSYICASTFLSHLPPIFLPSSSPNLLFFPSPEFVVILFRTDHVEKNLLCTTE